MSANELTQANTDEIIMLSNDTNEIDDVQLDSIEPSSEPVLCQTVSEQNTNEIENDSLLTYNEDVQLLRESPQWATRNLYGGT